MKIFLVFLLICTSALHINASEQRFYAALDRALSDSTTITSTASMAADTLQHEWQQFAAAGDSAMAAAICSEQIAQAIPGTPEFIITGDYLDTYYRANSDGETLLRRMMETETLNLEAGYASPQRLAAIGHLLKQVNIRRSYDSYRVAIKTILHDRQSADGVDYLTLLQSLECNRLNHAWLIYCLAAILLLAAGAAGTFAILHYRHHKNTTEPRNGFLGDDCNSASKIMLQLALTSYAQTKDLNLLVDRKLTAGQSKGLYSSISSGKIIGEITDKFFTAFDAAIHSISPNFIANLNNILIPEKRFADNGDGRLSPELRLAALIHMDITDSNRLSEILGLSLNTIYTYRNRLKGRAQNRETFESDLKSI